MLEPIKYLTAESVMFTFVEAVRELIRLESLFLSSSDTPVVIAQSSLDRLSIK